MAGIGGKRLLIGGQRIGKMALRLQRHAALIGEGGCLCRHRCAILYVWRGIAADSKVVRCERGLHLRNSVTFPACTGERANKSSSGMRRAPCDRLSMTQHWQLRARPDDCYKSVMIM